MGTNSLFVLCILLAACGGIATPTPTNLPPTPPPPTPTLPPPPPTATSLADGVTIRLGTPDPNPDCPEHYPWFFDNPARECASFVANVWGVMQSFERGYMVWFQRGDPVLILIEDGSVFKPYNEAIDTVGIEPLAPDPNITPPEGYYQPELGFAKFWRGLVPGYDWVRDALGWATKPEEPYSAFYQCNTQSDDGARCYFSGPQDQIIVLTRGAARYWNFAKPPAP